MGHRPTALSYAQSANLLGMMFGAMFLGNLGDRFGRKRVIVDRHHPVCAARRSPACWRRTRLQLSVIRFCTGLGLGGVLPNVIALAAEISPTAPAARRSPAFRSSACRWAAACRRWWPAWLVPQLGWQALFVAGGMVPIVVALVIAWKLPESILFLTYRNRDRDEIARARARARSRAGHQRPDTAFALRGRAGAALARQRSGPLRRRADDHHAAAVADVRLHAAVHAFHQQLDVGDPRTRRACPRCRPRSPMARMHWGGAIAAIAHGVPAAGAWACTGR